MTDTVRGLLAAATTVLGGGAEPRREAEILAQYAFGQSRAWLFAHADDGIEAPEAMRLRALVARRAGGEPLAYITGRREFHSLELDVTPDVLIPRPETELLVEQALERIPAGIAASVADLGTGSGAVALAIAAARPEARVFATDASEQALAVARRNAERLGIGNVEFALGDWLAALPLRHFDVIVSNPPYIAANDQHLKKGDLRFEPESALVSGRDGLDAIRAIISATPAFLRADGWLLLEHGFDQGPAVRALLERAGFVEAASIRDLERRERVSSGRLPG